MCGFSTLILFLPLFPQELTQMSFHTSYQLDQRCPDQQQSQVAWLYSMFCSDLTHQFVWFVAVWSSEPQHTVGGRFENQGMGMTQQQGVQPEFLLAPLSWEPSGRQRGASSAVKSPTCLGT